MIEAPVNRFKARLAAGEIQWGVWNSLASPVTAEALSLVGFDWMLFDTEHSPVEIASLQQILQAAATGSAAARTHAQRNRRSSRASTRPSTATWP